MNSFRTLPSFRLHLLANLSERFAESYYRSNFGLKLLECRVIGITGGLGEVAFKHVCREANLEKSHASRLINGLHAKGLIEKLDNPADHRSLVLSLTEQGRQVHAELHRATVALNERWTSVLSAQQRKVFMASVALLTEQIREMIDEAAPVEDAAAPVAAAQPLARPGPRKAPVGEADGDVVIDARTARRIYRLLGSLLGETGSS